MTEPDNPVDHDVVTAWQADHAFSYAAIAHLLEAVRAGAGDMAMFDHAELGGPGQWMRGGLILTGRPDDTILTHRIDALCQAISEHVRAESPTAQAWPSADSTPQARWWPDELGSPDAAGASDELAYAYFRAHSRLAVRRGGDVTLFDTGAAEIIGVAQNRSDGQTHTVFTTPEGELTLDDMVRVATPEPEAETGEGAAAGILDTLERLGELHAQGMLTDAEFTAKKRELLDRL